MEVAVKFKPPLRKGILLKRYKRFLADVRCENGEKITAFCPNTGSMKSCSEPGRPVCLSYHPESTRKYRYTWEMIQMGDTWVGVNTGMPNNLTALAAQYSMIPEFISYPQVKREVRYGVNSRIDLLLEGPPGKCYVEVKNVSMRQGDVLCFPDAVSKRGTKHLEELIRTHQDGHRAVMLFLVQRSDGKIFRPADHIDPTYGETLRRAAKAGVEILAYRAKISPAQVEWGDPVPLDLSPYQPE